MFTAVCFFTWLVSGVTMATGKRKRHDKTKLKCHRSLELRAGQGCWRHTHPAVGAPWPGYSLLEAPQEEEEEEEEENQQETQPHKDVCITEQLHVRLSAAAPGWHQRLAVKQRVNKQVFPPTHKHRTTDKEAVKAAPSLSLSLNIPDDHDSRQVKGQTAESLYISQWEAQED